MRFLMGLRLKLNLLNKLILLFLLVYCYPSIAQKLILKDSFEIKNVKQMSFDLEGNFYLLSKTNFTKISAISNERLEFSLPKEILSFSVLNKWKLYLYGNEELIILNQKLVSIGEPFPLVGNLFTVDQENRLWNYTSTKNTLTVTDLLTNQTLAEISVGREPHQLFTEKNKIYVVFKNGVEIYNELGSQINKIPLASGILIPSGDNVFILSSDRLKELKGILKFTLPFQPELAAVGSQELALYKGGKVYIYFIK